MDFSVRLVRWCALGILVLYCGLVALMLIFGKGHFENWYVGLAFLGVLGVLISAALISIDKRLHRIESKLRGEQ
jgi:hypothetical protein